MSPVKALTNVIKFGLLQTYQTYQTDLQKYK